MSDFFALETLCSKSFNKQSDGTVTVTFPTPNTRNYRGLAPAGPIPGEGAEGPETVLSVSPQGRIEHRPKGTNGSWEKAEVSKDGFLIFKADGRRFEIPFRD